MTDLNTMPLRDLVHSVRVGIIQLSSLPQERRHAVANIIEKEKEKETKMSKPFEQALKAKKGEVDPKELKGAAKELYGMLSEKDLTSYVKKEQPVFNPYTTPEGEKRTNPFNKVSFVNQVPFRARRWKS